MKIAVLNQFNEDDLLADLLDKEDRIVFITRDACELTEYVQTHPEIDTVVDLTDIERQDCNDIKAIFNKGCAYITANRSLVNKFGIELDAAARANHAAFRYTASVGIGSAFTESIACVPEREKFLSLGGIFDGCVNYALNAAERESVSLETAMNEARLLGYTACDISKHMEGRITAERLKIAVMMAFGVFIPDEKIKIDGLDRLLPIDWAFAREKGQIYRLCGNANVEGSTVGLVVFPMLAGPSDHEAHMNKCSFFIRSQCLYRGYSTYSGTQEGRIQIALNIISDIKQIKLGNRCMTARPLTISKYSYTNKQYRYYLRLPRLKWNMDPSFKAMTASREDTDIYSLIRTEPLTPASVDEWRKAYDVQFLAAYPQDPPANRL